jgi:hypothetical protein
MKGREPCVNLQSRSSSAQPLLCRPALLIRSSPTPRCQKPGLKGPGNDRKDVIKDHVYLAFRGKAAPGDVLAVMNTDDSGATLCDSGTLPLASPNPFYGLAYDGRFVADGAKCGTSFSTPRVAWLLALRQAYNAPVAPETWPDWYGSYRTGIAALQSPSQPDSRRYWLSVARLFDGL